ncbi:hypothetical protein HX889_24415 [Pseudomonas reactans]|nr:hypothetical protein [Pseudomonas reactans]
MKPTGKAALGASVFGIAAGFGFAWILPGAVWWAPVALGIVVAAGAYAGIVQQMATERVANGNIAAQDK